MAKRKLKGPASVRAKEKKSRTADTEDGDDPPSSGDNGQSESSADHPTTVMKADVAEDVTRKMQEEDSIMEKMALLEDELDEETESSRGRREDAVPEENENISDEELLKETLSENDSLHDDDENDNSGTLMIKLEKEEYNDPEETLSEMIKTKVTAEIRKLQKVVKDKNQQQEIKIKSLEGRIKSLEAEKAELSTKYKKYKDMAVKFDKERKNAKNSNVGSSSAVNKELEEENEELKMKLKRVLDEKNNEAELKNDVSSKMQLKDHMLQQERIKNEQLELKFKNFLSKFYEKFSKGGGNSLTENAVSTLKTSLEESQVANHLSDAAKPAEVTKKLENKIQSNHPEANKSNEESKVDKFKESLETKLTNVNDKSKSNSAKKVVTKSAAQSAPMVKTGAAVSNPKKPVTRATPVPIAPKPSPMASLNKTLPAPATAPTPRGPATRRQSLVSTSSDSSKPSSTTPAPVTAPAPAPAASLPSKLAANTSISIGRSQAGAKQAPEKAETSSPSSAAVSSKLSKLSKLSGTSVSLSSSPAAAASPAQPAPAKVNLPKGSRLTMLKSTPSPAPQEKPTPESAVSKDRANILNSSGISFAKVGSGNSVPADKPKHDALKTATPSPAPSSKPSVPPKSLSSLKGISLSKPAGEGLGGLKGISLSKAGVDNSPQRPEANVTSKESVSKSIVASSNSNKLSLVSKKNDSSIAQVKDPENPAPASVQPQAKTRMRGPASARRKAIESPKASPPAVSKSYDASSDAEVDKLLEDEAAESSLSLTYEKDEADGGNHSVSISVGEDFLKDINLDNTEIPWDKSDGAGGGDMEFESLLSKVSNELKSLSETRTQDQEKARRLLADEKLLL